MPDSTAGSGKFGSISGNRAKISIEEPGVASCRQLMDNGMASVSQLNPYQCDQCGTANIVAAPVLYQQGTHTYSTRFHSGTTQSFSAQAAATARSSGYLRPLLFGDYAIAFFTLWGFVGLRLNSRTIPGHAARLSGLRISGFWVSRSVAGMVFSFRKVARYNREVYPRLHWNWEHTYICRRCGRFRLIPS